LTTLQWTNATDLQRLLDIGAVDEAVLDCFARLLQSWNLEAAATGFLGAAGRVCHRRPHMAGLVLQVPVDCLVQLGVESAEGVLRWVRFRLDQEASHLIEDAGPEGLRWLRTKLAQHQELLQQLVAEGKRRFPAS
jgi:hypothetical protein